MTIAVSLTPEIQAELSRQAAAHGTPLEAYAAALLQEAALLNSEAKRIGLDRLERTLREVAQFSFKVPSLPDHVLTREALYQDAD